MQQGALFLDRDGIINIDHDYVHRIEDFHWQEGIFDLTRAAIRQGLTPVVVTNQSGIGRGYYTRTQFDILTDWMCERFAAEAAPITRVYHCPYLPDAALAEYRADHPWRKPKPGMLLAARDDLGLDLARSVMIGDRWGDMQAAQAAGVPLGVIVGARAKEASPEDLTDAITIIRHGTVREAAQWMESRVSG